MKIVVCLKEVIDPALSLDAGLKYNVVFKEGAPVRLNPSDAAALAIAFDLKSRSDESVEITLLSIGPAAIESHLRNGLALGADKITRIWDDGLDELSSYNKARLLAATVSLSGADIVLTGARSLDTASGVVGPMLAARLGLPCIGDVGSLAIDFQGKSVIATSHISRGEQEKIECFLPAVITIRGEKKLPYAPLEKYIESRQSNVPVLALSDLGISLRDLDTDPAPVIGPDFPRPRPVKVPPLNTSLPAFARILQLLQGGVSRRKGLLLAGTIDEQAEQLFRVLIEDGVLSNI